MKFLHSIIILSVVSLSLCADLPVIDVYLESLCPGCMAFVGGSFKNFNLNKDHEKLAVVNFYPYGNANEKWNGKQWDFTCQHGENECYGNLVETCAIKKFDVNGGHAIMICIEENIPKFDKDFDKTLEHCLPDEIIRNEILACAKNDEGNGYMHENAQKTPKHNYVPWVLVNGQYDKDVENKILSNMLSYLCDISGHQFEGCQEVLSMVSSNMLSNKVCHNIFEKQVQAHVHVNHLNFLNDI
jgi:interferon gamma-inducible protein 30